MIDVHSLAGRFYFIFIDGKLGTIEVLQEFEALYILKFKTDGVSWVEAMEKLHHNASKLQELHDCPISIFCSYWTAWNQLFKISHSTFTLKGFWFRILKA